jgi:DNA-binding MarR family transcriptional regulator
VPDRQTLAQTELAVRARVGGLALDLPAADALSSLYRAANAVRNHLTQTVLRPYDLTWTGFVVLWVVWVWDGQETRHVAENVGISKATLTGVVKTLEARGWVDRVVDPADRRRVRLSLTAAGLDLMERLYPEFNAEETRVVAALSPQRLRTMTGALRSLVLALEQVDTDVTALQARA